LKLRAITGHENPTLKTRLLLAGLA